MQKWILTASLVFSTSTFAFGGLGSLGSLGSLNIQGTTKVAPKKVKQKITKKRKKKKGQRFELASAK